MADADKANAAGNEFLANVGGNWVDVRDLAEAHTLALEKEAAGGQRIIVSCGMSHSLVSHHPSRHLHRAVQVARF